MASSVFQLFVCILDLLGQGYDILLLVHGNAQWIQLQLGIPLDQLGCKNCMLILYHQGLV